MSYENPSFADCLEDYTMQVGDGMIRESYDCMSESTCAYALIISHQVIGHIIAL